MKYVFVPRLKIIAFMVIFNLGFFCNASNANETINQETVQALHLYVEEIAEKVNVSYNNNDFVTINFGEDDMVKRVTASYVWL